MIKNITGDTIIRCSDHEESLRVNMALHWLGIFCADGSTKLSHDDNILYYIIETSKFPFFWKKKLSYQTRDREFGEALEGLMGIEWHEINPYTNKRYENILQAKDFLESIIKDKA